MQTEGGMGVRIAGIGVELPARVVTTAEVEEQVDLVGRFGLEPGWLEHVTGVRERRAADPDTQPSALAAAAAARALDDAALAADDIDTVIFAGISRDCLEPAVANLVADRLGARTARVFDLVNACNSVMDGVDVADALVRSGKAARVLVATGEVVTRAMNYQPRTMEELLQSVAGLVVGDGGAAVVLEGNSDPSRGVLARDYRSDPTAWRHAIGGYFRPQVCEVCGGMFDRSFRCNGRGLLDAALPLLVASAEATLARVGWTLAEIDIAFCHQPTKRFVDMALPFFGVTGDDGAKLWPMAESFGNTSTCSLPLAMHQARAAGRLTPGTKALLLAPSSGVSAAALAMIW